MSRARVSTKLGRIAVGLVVFTTAPAMTARAETTPTTGWYLPSLILTFANEPGPGIKGRNLFVPLTALGTSSCGTEAIDEGLRVIAKVAEALGGGGVASSMLLAEPCGSRVSTTPIVMPAQIGRGGYGISVVGRF